MKKILSIVCICLMIGSAYANDSDTTKIRQIDLDEVIINASRVHAKLKNLPNKVEVIKAEPVFNGTASDVGALLIQNTGVDIIQYPGKLSAVGIRGFSPSTSNKYNALLINGIPAGTQNISTIDLSMVQQVELMKGPFSSLYGSSAMGGVINIVTPQSRGRISGNANLAFGSFMTGKAAFNAGGTIHKGLNFDLGVYTEHQGIDYTIGSNNLLAVDETEKAIIGTDSYGKKFAQTKYSQIGSNYRLGYDFTDDWSLSYLGGIYFAKDILSNGSFYNVYGTDKKDITRNTNSFELLGNMGSNNVSFRPYFHSDISDYYNNASDTAFIDSKSTFKNYGFQLQDRISFGGHTVILGVDNNTQNYAANRWSNNTTEVAPYRPDYINSATGILAQGQLSFMGGKMNISLGGRFDLINFKIEASELIGNEEASEKHAVFNPNIGIKYFLSPNLNAHGSFGTAFFAPNAYQKAGSYKGYYTYEGNPDLKPENSNTFDAGIGYKNQSVGIDFDITYFQTSHRDMIVQVVKDQATGVRTYDNANEAHMNGIEIMASYDFGALADYDFSLKVYANFTKLLEANVQIEAEDAEQKMKYVRDNTGNFGLQFLRNRLSAKLNARYIGHRIEDNWFVWYPNVRPDLPPLAEASQPEYWEKNLLKHPKHLVFDANVYYDINEAITLGASAGNLFDENYTEKDGYNMPGRHVMGRCIIKF